MRFKSGKSSPALSFEPVLGRTVLPYVLLALITPIPSAHATLSFDAVEPYLLVDDDTIHFSADPALDSTSASYDSTQLIDTDADFQNFVFTSGADASENSITVELDSGTAFSTTESGKRLVVVVYTDTQNGGDSLPVPIQAVDGTDCSTDEGNCSVTSEVGATTYFFAGHSDQDDAVETLQISLNPRAICQAVYAQDSETPAVGCDGNEVETPTADDPVTFRLTFAVGFIDETDPTEVFALADAEETSNELTLSFHAKEPEFSCPAMTDVYFPGDGQVRLDTGFSTDESSGDAPITKLIVVAEKDAAPDTGSSWATTNTIAERLTLGTGVKSIDGFENTTDGSDNTYHLRFSVRDVTGRMAVFPSSASCILDDVHTSEIEGFLSESKCFIATAAFRDGRAAPVMWLRRFRDEVLLRSGAGRSFVSMYYRWSPPAADWLISHPLFRIPVLAILLPIAPLAGLLAFLLTGASAAPFALAAGGAGAGVWFAWRRRRSSSSPHRGGF